jgi:arylformamidase
MTSLSIRDLRRNWRADAAWLRGEYDNRARVPGFAAHLERWADGSRQVRATHPRASTGIAYGARPKQTLDVFAAADDHGPVLVFIHGGWWRALDKDDFSFVATAFNDAGITVVVPNYTLCPDAGIDDIALEMAQATAWTYRNVAKVPGSRARRVVVAGHSAGGHLAAMLLCTHWSKLARDLPDDLMTSALSLSGVFDLEPLRHADFLQPDLRLTPNVVRRASPAGFTAPQGRALGVLDGADESAEFHRQSRLIEAAWGSRCVPLRESLTGHDHFSIVSEFVRPGSRCHALALAMARAESPWRP